MAKKPTVDISYSRILVVVISLMFGLMVLGVVFKAFSTDTDIRSQAAARTDITAGIWDFNGSTLDAWTADHFATKSVGNGFLLVILPKTITKSPYLNRKDLQLSIPAGNKTFRMRMAVGTPTATPQTDPPRFTMNVYYRLEGKSNWENPIPIEGKADGVYREYAVKLPVIAGILVSELQINMSGVASATPVSVDWIKLTYQRTSAWNTNLPRPSITAVPRPPDNRVCIQVITWARNSKTQECKQFSTPCYVPEGWVADRTCSAVMK